MLKKKKQYLILLLFSLIFFLSMVPREKPELSHSNKRKNHTEQSKLLSEDQNTFIIGCDINIPPFSFKDENGRPTGFDIEFISIILNRLEIPFMIRQDQWSTILGDFMRGEIDMIAGIMFTEERAQYLDFTIPYNSDSISIFVRKNSKIKSINDLQYRSMAAMKDDAVTDAVIKGSGLSVNIVNYRTFWDAISDLNRGNQDFALLPYNMGMQFIKRDHLNNLTVTGQVVSTIQFRIGLKKGNFQLINDLNEQISLFITSEKYIDLKQRWLKYQRKELTSFLLLKYVGIILIPIVFILLLIWTIILRMQVKQKTKTLVTVNNELKIMSITDYLTGISNRRFFYDIAEKEFIKSKRNLLPLSILMMDIDDFKLVNDTFGHDKGDETLKLLGNLVSSLLRKYDLFARYGGEEFIVLLPNTDKKNALLIAERIRKTIEDNLKTAITYDRKKQNNEISVDREFIPENQGDPAKMQPSELPDNLPADNSTENGQNRERQTKVEEKEYSVTISIGVSSIAPDDLKLEEIIKRADMALYIAKSSGKNKVIKG